MGIQDFLKKATHRLASLLFAFLELTGLPRVSGGRRNDKEKT